MTHALPPGPSYRPEEPLGWSAQRLIAAARRQAPWVIATTLLVVALTVVFTLRQQPIYEARATLRIEDRPGAPAERDLLSALTAPSTIETEIEILRSRSVAEDVVDSLGLNVWVAAPEGTPRGSVFARVRAGAEAANGVWTLRRDASRASVAAPTGATVDVGYGEPLLFEGLEATLVAPPQGPDRLDVVVGPLASSANALRAGLRVSRAQANAAIVAVAFEGTDPALSREVVNAVSRSYVARRNQMQKRQARAAVIFLEGQVATIGRELTAAEAALEEFRRRALVVDPETQATEQVQRYAELRAQRDELADRSQRLEEIITRADDSARSGSWTVYGAAPVIVENEAMSGLIQQLSEAETERSRLLARRTAEDPDVVSIGETMTLLEQRLGALAQEQLRVLREQLAGVDSILRRNSASLAQVPAAELEYARRQRTVEQFAELYTALQVRLKESEISEAVEIANIQVVDSAITPGAPIRPRKVMNLLFGLAGGLLLGAVVALLRETGDTKVRSREEVFEITGAPLLATVPRVPGKNGRLLKPAERVEKRLVVRNAPRSPAAEAYRSLRTNIAFSSVARDRPLRTLVVTSAEPQDGKTTTAVNLAVTLAEQGLRVALVEADLRRPVLHRLFDVPREPGITNVVLGTVALEDVVHRVELPGHAHGTLDFVPGGAVVPNPAELAGAPATRVVRDKLADRYDAVVLDTPPLSVVTDPAVAGTLADGVILVARMGATHRQALKRAVDELRGVGARIVGTVLTDVHETEDRYGYRYGYAYYDGDDEENA